MLAARILGAPVRTLLVIPPLLILTAGVATARAQQGRAAAPAGEGSLFVSDSDEPEPDAIPQEGGPGVQSPSFKEVSPTPSKMWPWDSDTLGGNWGGVRDKLGANGIVFSGTATADLSTVLSGGTRRGFLMPYLVDANLSVDFGKLGLWKGGEAFVDFQQAGCTQQPTNYVADFWGWDSISPMASSYTQLAQYWIGQSLADGAIKLKLGKMDANVDFSVSYPGLLFVNSAAYYPGPLVTEMPTYPNQAGGFEVLINPVDWFHARFGMFDGSTNQFDPQTGGAGAPTGDHGLGGFLWENSGAYFLIAEGGPRWSKDGMTGHLDFGWWQQTGDSVTPPISAAGGPSHSVQGPWGLYVTAAQDVYRPAGDADGRKLSAFGQFGWGDPQGDPAQWSVMGGVSWQGVLPDRAADTVGALVAYSQFSGYPAMSVSPGQGEFVAEAFYNLKLNSWLSVQPDLQYLNQPTQVAGSGAPDTWILTFRVSVSF